MSDKKKSPPICPKCKQEMKTAGHSRSETKVRTLFQCMNLSCKNHGTYTRKGVRMGSAL